MYKNQCYFGVMVMPWYIYIEPIINVLTILLFFFVLTCVGFTLKLGGC